MRAFTSERYGPPASLRLQELPPPVPTAGRILVRVGAVSLNAGDWHMLRGTPWLIRLMASGLLRPKFPVLGSDVAGEVLAVGSGVTGIEVGDAVVGDVSEAGYGAFAEVVAAPANVFVQRPGTVAIEDAVTLPVAARTALQGLRAGGGLTAGRQVLINGASGGVGHFAVQLAAHAGAEVTAVTSGRNLAMVRELGAIEAIDYTCEDYTQRTGQFDLILDCAAFRPVTEAMRALRPAGTYAQVGGEFVRMGEAMRLGPWKRVTSQQRVVTVMTRAETVDLQHLMDLLAAGVLAPVIQEQYAFTDLPRALALLEEGHVAGKLVIRLS